MTKKILLALIASALYASVAFSDAPKSGQWKSDCTPFRNATLFQKGYVTLDFERGVSIEATDYFRDAACTDQYASEAASSKIARFTPSPVGDGFYNLDVAFTEILIEPTSQITADHYNAAAACGYTDWEVGVYKSQMGTSCGPPPVDYNLIHFSTDGLTFQLGLIDADHNTNTPAGRPTELDATVWTRF